MKTANSLMPNPNYLNSNNVMNNNNNNNNNNMNPSTFASLPDLSSFHYNLAEPHPQDNFLSVIQLILHNIICIYMNAFSDKSATA